MPNRAARLARAEIAWIEADLADFILRVTQVTELAQILGGYAVDQVPLEGYHPYRPHPDHSRPHDVVAPLVSAAEAALHHLRWPTDTANYIARTAPSPDQQNIWQLPRDLAPNPEPLSADAVASVVEAHEMLVGSLRKLCEQYPQAGSIALSGHAHIDLAWLWPIDETRRKAVRTFRTAVDLMDRYPDYRFNQSTAQYYAWLEEDDPALLPRIKEKVAAGQWEPIGAMWVEPDTNMPTGESFVRQLLYGIRYFDKLFGRERRTNVNWLPDCFGFSPAFPQLLRLAGLDSFFTHKTNWSERNKLPSDLFWWEGLDGSRVLMHTYDNPAGGYNAWIGPRAAVETWRNYQDKESNPESLLLFGWGDGGGGPTENMLRAHPPACRLSGDAGAPLRECRRVVFRYREARRREPARVGRRDLPRISPRHTDHAGANEISPPPRRARTDHRRDAGEHGGDARCSDRAVTGGALAGAAPQPVPRHHSGFEHP